MRVLAVVAALAGCCSESYVTPDLPAARVQQEPYVFVLGQVERPGRYQLVAPTTLTKLLATVKLTPLAWREPLITRTAWDGRKVRARVSLARIEEGTSPDVWLFPGDVVFIGERTY
jgi:protein involved in polysaccharide export with SLBB domain